MGVASWRWVRAILTILSKAVGDFVAGFDDGGGAGFIEAFEFGVGGGGRGFEGGVGADDGGGDGTAADGEVEDGPLGGGAVEDIGGDLHLAHGVFFGAEGG